MLIKLVYLQGSESYNLNLTHFRLKVLKGSNTMLYQMIIMISDSNYICRLASALHIIYHMGNFFFQNPLFNTLSKSQTTPVYHQPVAVVVYNRYKYICSALYTTFYYFYIYYSKL